MNIMGLFTVYQFWLLLLDTGGRFLTWEKELGSLTPTQRVCCGALLSEEATPEFCLEEGTGCPVLGFSPKGAGTSDREWQRKTWGLFELTAMVMLKSTASVVVVMAVLLVSTAIVPEDMRMDYLGALEGTCYTIRQSVVAKLEETALGFVFHFILSVDVDVSTAFVRHMQFSSTWGTALAVATLFIGTSGHDRVPRLHQNKVYILVKYVYFNVIFPLFLAATGLLSLADSWACLTGACLPTAVFLFVRACRLKRGEGGEAYLDRLLFCSRDSEDGIGRRRSSREQWKYLLRALGIKMDVLVE